MRTEASNSGAGMTKDRGTRIAPFPLHGQLSSHVELTCPVPDCDEERARDAEDGRHYYDRSKPHKGNGDHFRQTVHVIDDGVIHWENAVSESSRYVLEQRTGINVLGATCDDS